MDLIRQQLLSPDRVWSRTEVLAKPSPVPKKPGIYGWYFKELPPHVPDQGCAEFNGLTLLYVGIAPKAPPKNKPPSGRTLHDRARNHLRGNAKGSTLRLTLGCLLANQLGIELRRVGSGKRMTFAAGEEVLNEWLDLNAFMTWVVSEEPWFAEEAIIPSVSLPLNLDQNKGHPFYPVLSAARKEAKRRAKELPVVP